MVKKLSRNMKILKDPNSPSRYENYVRDKNTLARINIRLCMTQKKD